MTEIQNNSINDESNDEMLDINKNDNESNENDDMVLDQIEDAPKNRHLANLPDYCLPDRADLSDGLFRIPLRNKKQEVIVYARNIFNKLINTSGVVIQWDT